MKIVLCGRVSALGFYAFELTVPTASAEAIQGDGDDEQDTPDNHLPVDLNLGQDQGVINHANQQATQEGAQQAAAPAGQSDAA